jgi:hypothetical protein
MQYLVLNPTEIQFTQQYENSPFITETTKNEILKTASPLSDLLERANDENLLKDLPFEMLMSMFSGVSMGLLKSYSQKKTSTKKKNAAIYEIWDILTKNNAKGV